MSFIQIVELHTKQFDKLQALSDAYFEATEGKRTVERSIITRDRNDPDRYVLVVFFDSYESAMDNSGLAETGRLAEQQQALLDQPPTFHDLDVIGDQS
jgi:hypothetical protein